MGNSTGTKIRGKMTIANKTFPQTPCYHTYYPLGAGGNFITTLIFKFLYGDVKAYLNDYGASHNQFHPVYQNMKYNIGDIKEALIHTAPPEPSRYIDPLIESRPIIFRNHGTPHFHTVFNKYPLSKLILITASKDMYPRMNGNYFYKTIIENYYKNTNSFMFTYKHWQDRCPAFKQIINPTLLTIEEIENLLKDIDTIYDVPESYYIPDQFKKNCFLLSYKDIIYDMNKTLDFLSNIIEKPIQNHIISYYKKYLDKQQELVSTKMPWVTM